MIPAMVPKRKQKETPKLKEKTNGQSDKNAGSGSPRLPRAFVVQAPIVKDLRNPREKRELACDLRAEEITPPGITTFMCKINF